MAYLVDSMAHWAGGHGIEALVVLAVTEPPCGHCRQFLQETGCLDLEIVVRRPDGPLKTSLASVLPCASPPSNPTVGQGRRPTGVWVHVC